MKDWPRDILSLLLAIAEPTERAALRATCRDLRAVPLVRGTHLVVYAGNPLSRGGAARLRHAVASENWSFLWAAVPSVIFHVAGTHAAASVAGFMSLVPLATTVRIVADHSASIYHPLDVARVVGRRVAGGDGQVLLDVDGLVPVSGVLDRRGGRGLHAQMLRPGGALVVSRGVPVPVPVPVDVSIMIHSTAPPPSVPGGCGLSMLTSLRVHLPALFLPAPAGDPPVWLVPGSLPGLRRLCVLGTAAEAPAALAALAVASPGLRELEISVDGFAALWRHWPELHTLITHYPGDTLPVAALVAEAAQPGWLPRLRVLAHDDVNTWHRVPTPAWLKELIAALAGSGRPVPVDVPSLVDAAVVGQGQGRGVRLRCVHVCVPEDTAAGAVWPHAQEVRVRFRRTMQRRDMEALARRLVGECFPAAQRWRFFGATVPMVSVLRLACPFPADLRFVELNHPDGSPLRYRQRTAAVAWGLAERCPRLAVESRRGRAPPGRVGLIIAELFRKHGVARYRL